MRIKKLTMRNFGPFVDEQSIELDVTPSAPMVVIHGENMRGKSSLQNAIRWCLYGEALVRGGTRKPTHRLISYDALDASNFVTSVTIDFEHNAHNFRLQRTAQAEFRPRSDQDLTEQLSLTKDGSFYPEQDIQGVINGILHKSIARFFLFDGEMLAQYEELVSDGGRSSELIRNSIEQILGLPALQLAGKDVEKLSRAAERDQAKAMKGVLKAQRLIREADELQTAIDSLDCDLNNLNDSRNKYVQERDQTAELRERYVEIQAELSEADRLEESIKTAKNAQSEIREEIRTFLAEGWWEPVSAVAESKARNLEQLASSILEKAKSKDAKQQILDQLQSLVSNGVCPVCQQTTTEHKEHEAQIEELRRELKGPSPENDDPSKAMLQAEQLRRFSGNAKTELIASKEKDFRRATIRIRQDEQTLTQIKERLRENDRSEIRKVQKQYDTAVIQLRNVEESITNQQRLREEKNHALLRTNAEIAKLPEANPQIKTESQIYQALVVGISKAVEMFAHELREEVEKVATEIFLSLTAEKDFDRLSINEQYGLSILDKKKRNIADRSAGAEQIVALSLIAALNRCSVTEGPIIMDTPFGRLDTIHRAKILKFLPKMGVTSYFASAIR